MRGVFYEEDGESHQVAALGVAVVRADKFGHVKPDGMIRHLKIPGCGVWSFTYNLRVPVHESNCRGVSHSLIDVRTGRRSSRATRRRPTRFTATRRSAPRP